MPRSSTLMHIGCFGAHCPALDVSSLSCVVFPQSKAIHEARFEAARKTGVEPATAVARARAAATAAATTRPPYFFLGASATRGWCSAGIVLYWRTVMMHYDRIEYLSGHERQDT